MADASSGGNLHVRWIEDEGAFGKLAEEWERLAAPRGVPFLRHAWFSAWWRAFGGGGRLHVCTAWRGDELAAAFPLRARGRMLEALANEHTPEYGLLGSGDALEAVVEAAVAEAAELQVVGLAAGDPAAALLERAARRRGLVAFLEPHHVSPIVTIDGTFEEYGRRIPKSLRKDSARRRRRLESDYAVTAELVHAPHDLDAALARGFAVEASGWKGRRGTAIASRPETERFYRELAHAFAAADRLRLSTLVAGGRAIAFDYCVLDDGRLWSLKLGYDEEFGRYAPGILLTLAEIERCYELGVDALELLGDAEPWKQRFADRSRPHVDVRAYARRPVPLVRYATRRALRPTARAVYRRLVAPRLSGRRRSRSR